MAVTTAEPYVPAAGGLDDLRAAAQSCHGCDLYRHATQAVFGAGSPSASVMLIGEQPGDREDITGEPFTGPAGKLLDRALDEVGIDRDSVYVTNAVKHFRFDQRGKRRIHKTPGRTEVVACLPWLLAELSRVRPDTVVCLGATAAKAVLGTGFRLTENRGSVISPPEGVFEGLRVVATVHPSAVLRAPDRDQAYADFVADLRVVA
ncbi:UdgX family uracil-DNA binding protein [Actinokineospora iranica]|uniref:Type-4 uracil-DNA glycosylase n=1 Tax=Actinokineospora iranica TaxID=1271860 RepID=A0A1G6WQL5_9PSEU|nr:UdgX family uracil-DNA binding protein [Actinokineospora iranica]SDD67386.1 DNA polymerase [Actinokineospora iranica]